MQTRVDARGSVSMGEAARSLSDLTFEAVAHASNRVAFARDQARMNAIATIRKLERRLQDALGGDVLRGMVRLTERDWSYRGARVRAHDMDERVPRDNRWHLVVGKDGRLEMLGYIAGIWQTKPAHDGDLTAEDLEHVQRVFAALVERHVQSSAATVANYHRLHALAERLR